MRGLFSRQNLMISGVLLGLLGCAWFLWDHQEPSEPEQARKPISQSGQTEQKLTSQWEAILHLRKFKQEFRLKKKTEILGLTMLHLESRRIPQQVIIAERVPSSSSDIFFKDKPDVTFISFVANQLLALRKSKKPLHLTINHLTITSSQSLTFGGQQLQQRQIDAEILLSTEAKARHYQATILAYPFNVFQKSLSPDTKGDDSQTMIITFAKPEDFDPALLGNLFKNNPQLNTSNVSNKQTPLNSKMLAKQKARS